MALKTPLPDDVFQKWLKSKDSKDIEKVFGRKSSEISPMEVVGKEIQKTPALMFKANVSKISADKKGKDNKNLYSYKQLEKEKFYKFDHQLSKENWKEKSFHVAIYKNIQESKCPECKGNGLKNCSQCNGNGTIQCNDCKDDKHLNCKDCKGSGTITQEIQLYDEKGKTDKVKRKISCPTCHGKSKFLCTTCGSTKKAVCNKCKGEGGSSCKKCEGTGIVYQIPEDLVPISYAPEVYFFWNHDMENQMAKSTSMKGKELSDMLEKQNVEPIRVSNLKDLDQKNLEALLGFWDKDASRQINECKKSFEQKKKGNDEEPKFPIELYPLQKIDIETYKNKKFSIYSIGSQNGYVTFDLGF